MKFIVWRNDMVTVRNWPIVVEADADTPADEIVRIAFRAKGWPDYEPRDKRYVVVPMNEAMVVSFIPINQYTTRIDPYV